MVSAREGVTRCRRAPDRTPRTHKCRRMALARLAKLTATVNGPAEKIFNNRYRVDGALGTGELAIVYREDGYVAASADRTQGGARAVRERRRLRHALLARGAVGG